MKIKRKVALLNSVLLILFAISIMLFILLFVSSSFDQIMKMNSKSLVDLKIESLQGKVDLAYRIALLHYNNTKIPESERKLLAAEELSSLTFDDGQGYFFAYEKKGENYYFAFNGSETEVTGERIDLDQTDASGKKYRREIIENAGNKDRPVEYYFVKPGTDKVLKKISISRAMSSWNWIIVSGIYFDDIESKINEQTNSINTVMKRIIVGVVLIICIVLVISILITRRISKKIVQPIDNISRSMKEISSGQGDLTSRIEVFSDDETGELSESFNDFVDGIRKIILDIVLISRELKEESETMKSLSLMFAVNSRDQAAASEEVTSSVEEVTAGIEQINDTTEIQSEELAGLTGEIDIISRGLNDISTRMLRTDGLIELMNVNANQGEKSLEEINSTIEILFENSERMNEIVSMIRDVSDKINLLSLNAAIESARAGEAGRGFAVVADEISKLADETSGSIKNIENLIRINGERISIVTGSVKQTTLNFKIIKDEMIELRAHSEAVTKIMENYIIKNMEMNAEIKEISERSAGIKNATNEHMLGMLEITNSLSQINDKTESIAANSSNLGDSAEKIKDFSIRLNSKTSLFNI